MKQGKESWQAKHSDEPIVALRQGRDELLAEWVPQLHRVRRLGRRNVTPIDTGIASFILERAFLRLLSLAILASTGKFKFCDRLDYPFALFDDWHARPGPYRFSQRMQLLYASAIHQPSAAARRLLAEQVGSVPHLNSGLFRPGAFEREDEADTFEPIPDEFFAQLLAPEGLLKQFEFALDKGRDKAITPDGLGALFGGKERPAIEDPDGDAVFINDVGSGAVLIEGLHRPGRRLMADRLAHWVGATPSAIEAERARHWVALTVWAHEGLKAPLPELAKVIRVGSAATPTEEQPEVLKFTMVPTELDWIELARHVSAMANTDGGVVMLETLLGESEILEGLGRHVDPLTGSMFRLSVDSDSQWRVSVRPRSGCTYVLYPDKQGHTLEELCVREQGRTLTISDRKRDQFVLNRMDNGGVS